MNLTMMKRLLCLGSAIAMILAAQGCDRNNIRPEDKMVTRVLSINSQTRTSLSGTDVVWEKGDTVCCIAVYEDERLDTDRHSVYYNIRPEMMEGSRAVIKLTCASAYTPKYIIYPSSESVQYNDGLIEIPAPATFVMRTGDFPKASNISVGTIDGDNVFMRNVMALMEFEVKYPENMDAEIDGIKQIVVSSNADEAISGTLLYNPEENVIEATYGQSQLTLLPPDEELYFPEGVYYFPLPAINLTSGLKVKLTRMDGYVAAKSYESPFCLERNRIIEMGSTLDWELRFENTIRVIGTAFSTLDKQLINNGWAFMEKDPGKNNICGKGLVGPFHLPENEDADFYFYVSKFVDDNSWRVTGGAGRRFGGTEHDYMLLPAIDGYCLISVFIQAGTQKSTYAITDNPASGVPTPVVGGEQQFIVETKNYTFNLKSTLPGVAYRLDLPTTTAAGFIEFKLTYEKN